MNFNADRAPFNQLLFCCKLQTLSEAANSSFDINKTSKLLYGIKMCKNMLKTKFMVLKFARKKREGKIFVEIPPGWKRDKT